MLFRRQNQAVRPAVRERSRIGAVPALLSAAGLLLASGTVLLGSGSAEAKTLPGITSVTIVAPNPSDPSQKLEVGQQFRVNATWSVPNSALPGDTFGLTFPSPITGYSSTFTLTSPSAALPVGTCVVTSNNITCTLGKYVSKYDNVHGTLFFEAKADAAISTSPIDFTTSNGAKIPVALPGGGVVEHNPNGPPTRLEKYGVLSADGKSILWRLFLPADIVEKSHPRGTSFSFQDNYTPGLTISDVTVGYIIDWTTDKKHRRFMVGTATQPNTYTLVPAASGHGFTITINLPDLPNENKNDPVYFVTYHTAVPVGAKPGTTYENQLIFDGTVVDTADVVLVNPSGSGSGVAPTPTPTTKTTSASPSPTASSTSSNGGVASEQANGGLANTGTQTGSEIALGLGLVSAGLLFVLAGYARRRTH